MQAIDDYRLGRHPGPYASWPPDTPLYKVGGDTGLRVPGYVLDAQYRTPFGDLLVTSYDCPFEEGSTFVLLDPEGGIHARADLLAAYDSYLLVGHWPIGAGALMLHYADAIFVRLRLRPARWPFRRRVRIELDRVRDWQQDPRLLAAHARHRALLDAIAAERAKAPSPRLGED
jgi:hypothetical protein